MRLMRRSLSCAIRLMSLDCHFAFVALAKRAFFSALLATATKTAAALCTNLLVLRPPASILCSMLDVVWLLFHSCSPDLLCFSRLWGSDRDEDFSNVLNPSRHSCRRLGDLVWCHSRFLVERECGCYFSFLLLGYSRIVFGVVCVNVLEK